MHAMPERSIGTVVRDIGGNVDRIVRAELRFAVAELRLRLEAFGDVSLFVVAGVVAATLAALFILLAGMFALAQVVPQWVAALVIAALPGAIAVALFMHSRSQLHRRFPPTPRGLLGDFRSGA